jgi:DNA-directed RNA polymerase subunit omega
VENLGKIDSKFRYVIIAAKRAKQLLKGARPKVKSRSRNPIRIAQEEVLAGQVEYNILPVAAEAPIERDEGVPVAAHVHEELEEVEEVAEIEKEEVEEEAEEAAEEEYESEEELEEGIDDLLKEDKDE